MEFQIKFKVNEHLFLRNPESTELGKSIVKNAIELIYEMGFENFTFRKLALHTGTTEATIYRYFASKHKLLTYILNWYWSYIEFISKLQLAEIKDAREKMEILLEIITHQSSAQNTVEDYDLEKLNKIVIAESSKSYLVKEVDDINKEKFFNPLKSLCAFIAEIIAEAHPAFPYPRSLASTLLETSHDQQFFSEHLSQLTDNFKQKAEHKRYVLEYLRYLTQQLLRP